MVKMKTMKDIVPKRSELYGILSRLASNFTPSRQNASVIETLHLYLGSQDFILRSSERKTVLAYATQIKRLSVTALSNSACLFVNFKCYHRLVAVVYVISRRNKTDTPIIDHVIHPMTIAPGNRLLIDVTKEVEMK